MAYTLSRRREYLRHRSFFVVGGTSISDAAPFTKVPGIVLPITMVFSGSGSQWPEMAKDLIETDLEFRKDIVAMDGVLKGLKHPPNWTIESELYLSFRYYKFLTPYR